jgi:septal ring factor EnvC (AmiA/AmiB activator)
MLVKIPGTTYVRDTKTMALINTDQSGLEEYKVKSKLINNQKTEINTLKSEINDVKNDVREIKDLLLQLLPGNNNG